jgi:hypothetical protein
MVAEYPQVAQQECHAENDQDYCASVNPVIGSQLSGGNIRIQRIRWTWRDRGYIGRSVRRHIVRRGGKSGDRPDTSHGRYSRRRTRWVLAGRIRIYIPANPGICRRRRSYAEPLCNIV